MHVKNIYPRHYQVWLNMRRRCLRPAEWAYKYYGGRGIKICARWNDFHNFRKDMGERPTGTSLDRIDNDGDYKPSNCRWATLEEQSFNKINTRRITFNGQTLTVQEWADKLGIKRKTLLARLDLLGWSVERAINYGKGRTR